MNHEIFTLHNKQIIGMSREIAFKEGPDECPKFWNEYVEKIVKPVYIEGKTPNEFQQAAVDNNVGEFGLCTCQLPNHDCMTCANLNFATCSLKTFTYVIGGEYKGGKVPEGMNLYPIPNGQWLKIHFEGGMAEFQNQYAYFHEVWLRQHPEFKIAKNACTIEWYAGTDIQSPDYQCGVMFLLEDNSHDTL